MLVAPPTSDEDQRIELLQACELLDSPPEETYDRITRLASELLHTPIALVSLIDRDRQWFKSRVGLEVQETHRDYAFCAHALHQREPLVVNDASADERFADNPLVTGAPDIRFYAGVPLRSAEGIALGTLCVIDRQPRTLSAWELRLLDDLAELVRREILHREAAMQACRLAGTQALRVEDSESLLQATFVQDAVGVATLGLDGAWLRFNRKLCDLLGRVPAELAQGSFQQITHPGDLGIELAQLDRLLAGDIEHYTMEKRYFRGDGRTVWTRVSMALVRVAGEPQYLVTMVDDIDVRKQAEHSLDMLRECLEGRDRETDVSRLSLHAPGGSQVDEPVHAGEAELRAVLENAPDAYVCIDGASRIVDWNRQAEQTFGWPRAEALGRRFDELVLAPASKAAQRLGLQDGGPDPARGRRFELQAMTRYGALIPCEVRLSALPSARGPLYCLFLHDISERKALQRTLEQQAMADPLTGLPNRRALLRRLGEAIARAKRTDHPFALLFVDLDRFKQINDCHGHRAGDALLQQFGQRLQGALRGTDLVARLAGDEFVVLAERLGEGGAAAQELAAKITALAERPFELPGVVVRLGASVGVVICPPQSALGVSDLLAEADRAMYREKLRRKTARESGG